MADNLDPNVVKYIMEFSKLLDDLLSLTENVKASSTDLKRIFEAAKVQSDEAQKMEFDGQLGLSWKMEMGTAKGFAVSLAECSNTFASDLDKFRNQINQIMSERKLRSSDLGNIRIEIERILTILADLHKEFADFKNQMEGRCKTEAERLQQSLQQKLMEESEEKLKVEQGEKGVSIKAVIKYLLVTAVAVGCIVATKNPALLARIHPILSNCPSVSKMFDTIGTTLLALSCGKIDSDSPSQPSIQSISAVEGEIKKLKDNVESIRTHINQIDSQLEKINAQIDRNEKHQEAWLSIRKQAMQLKCPKDRELME